jgi:U3 small nucleolar RNA-associated protein MPP10
MKEEDSLNLGKTPFQIQREAKAKKIAKIEDFLVKEKPWHMTGEVVSTSRPKDSLLDEFIEFNSIPKVGSFNFFSYFVRRNL